MTGTYYRPALPLPSSRLSVLSCTFLGTVKNTVKKAGLTLELFLVPFKYEEDEFFESRNTIKFEMNIFTGIW